jgi:lipopolysaccharide export system permease protein
MKLKIYKTYILKSYLYYFLIVSLIFYLLSFFLNILEEIVFFEKYDVDIYYPILLTFLNTPSILFEIFPFIFLITSQLFFIKFKENEELNLLKKTGIDNFSLIRLLIYLSLMMGVLITLLFYTFSSNLKYNYLLIKNKFTDDNKYLAAINDNGLWIKDEYEGNIYVINADEFVKNTLKNVTINQLDNKFNLKSIIISEQADIESKEWKLQKVRIFFDNGKKEIIENLKVNTNFNREKLNSIFSNLTSLNLIQLINLSEDYKKLGLSGTEIKSQLLKLFSFPVLISIMTTIGSILVLSFNYKSSKFFNISLGVLSSVIIYYINYFFNLLGIAEKTPIILSICAPLIILTLFCFILLVRINEK